MNFQLSKEITRKYEVNDQFCYILDKVVNTKQNLLVLGKAGVGKSTLIEMIKDLVGKECNTAFLAPTGVAATRIGGQTIHSFFGLKPALYVQGKVFGGREVKELKEKLKVLRRIVIDEVSMVRADVMEAMDETLRKYRDEPAKAFGGVQVVLVGDIFQLPPIVGKGEKDHFKRYYGDIPHFFSSSVFRDFGNFEYLELDKIYRQKGDKEFAEILNRVRLGEHTEEDLQEINKHKIKPEKMEDTNTDFIYMATTNNIVDKVNTMFLDDNPNELYTFKAKWGEKVNPRNFLAPVELNVKEGCKVMLLNNDPQGRWVNGTIAFITEIYQSLDDEESFISVDVNGYEYEVYRASWGEIEYKYDEKLDKLIIKEKGSFSQFPIKVAYSVSIHKVQSATYNSALIDLGRRAFAPHMVYVALSRLTSREGLGLMRSIRDNEIYIDNDVKMFYENRFLNSSKHIEIN